MSFLHFPTRNGWGATAAAVSNLNGRTSSIAFRTRLKGSQIRNAAVLGPVVLSLPGSFNPMKIRLDVQSGTNVQLTVSFAGGDSWTCPGYALSSIVAADWYWVYFEHFGANLLLELRNNSGTLLDSVSTSACYSDNTLTGYVTVGWDPANQWYGAMMGGLNELAFYSASVASGSRHVTPTTGDSNLLALWLNESTSGNTMVAAAGGQDIALSSSDHIWVPDGTTPIYTRTVKSSGGDYTTLSAAEAGEQRNLTLYDEIARFECYAMQDTAVAQFDGWTTDATRYVHVYVLPAERHAGVWNTGKYRLVASRWTFGVLDFRVNGIVDGVQAENTLSYAGNDDSAHEFYSAGYVARAEFLNCLGRHTATDIPTGGMSCSFKLTHATSLRMVNCVGWGNERGVQIQNSMANAVMEFYNCTMVPRSTSSYGGFYIDSWGTGDTLKLKNFLVQASGANYVTSGETFTTIESVSNLSSDATANLWGGSGHVLSTTLDLANKAGGDFHLASTDTEAINAGADLSGVFTTDIAGVTRSSWDIGAFEYVSASTEYVYAGSGGLSFGGSAGLAKEKVFTASGGIAFGGAATTLYVPNVTKLYPTSVVDAGGYTRETGSSDSADLLAGVSTADAQYNRSVPRPVSTTMKFAFTALNSRPGFALAHEYGKDAASGERIDQTIQLRKAGALVREQVYIDVPVRPVSGSMDLSDLTLNGTYEVWLTDSEVLP